MASKETLFLFGEAEKGPYCYPLHCGSICQLYDQLGNAPPQTEGLSYAIQALLSDRTLIFFRVQEEGYSVEDYIHGLELLRRQERSYQLQAIGIPGAGDPSIIDTAIDVCKQHSCLLIVSGKDLYDYLTSSK